MSDPRYSFTQPICASCYEDRYPGRGPHTLVTAELETCCDCGQPTTGGIYLRVDPAEVDHPSLLKDAV